MHGNYYLWPYILADLIMHDHCRSLHAMVMDVIMAIT